MEQEKDNKEEKSQKEVKKEVSEPKSSKKQTLITLISVVVIIILIGLIVIYGKKKPNGDGQESATSKFFKEFAKEVKQENPAQAQLASLKLFEFNDAADLEFFNEKAEATTYAEKAALSIEKNVDGSPVLTLSLKTDKGQFSTANWEITKNFGDLSSYVGVQKGMPSYGKLRFKIWLSKNAINAIDIFLGNDPSNWVNYTFDKNSAKDEDWSDVVIDLKTPKSNGGEVDWTYIDWGRIIIAPNASDLKDTAVYLEDIEITDEK